MACPQERSLGWDFRKIFETPSPQVDGEAFFSVFGSFHDIEGHKIHCIFTKAKYQTPSVNAEGASEIQAVLIVRASDMSGMSQGESLKVDGNVYRIERVSTPVEGVIRTELRGFTG